MLASRHGNTSVSSGSTAPELALKSLELRAKLAALGADPFMMTQPGFDAYVKTEYAAMGEWAKASGLGIQ
jgi:tripartite-type tricarboxylate transporter receptor subunit TctC